MSKSKKTTGKKQPRKRAVKPGIDLDKAENLVDKLIADGTIRAQADKMAEETAERLAAIRNNYEDLKKQDETDKAGKEAFAESTQEQTLEIIKEYLALANQSPRTASTLPLDMLAFLDYNIFDNLHSYYVEVPLKALSAMSLPEVMEPLKKAMGEWYFKKFADILSNLIRLIHTTSFDEANIAELEFIHYDIEDLSNQGIEHLLNKKSEYEHKLQRLKEQAAVWKAHDEAHGIK